MSELAGANKNEKEKGNKMYIKKNYKNAQTARVTLQRELNRIGVKLSDVEYEIKKVKNSGYHPVVNNDGPIGRMLEKAGIIVTH